MCLLSVEVGYLKHNGEPYNENDLQVAASAAMLRANPVRATLPATTVSNAIIPISPNRCSVRYLRGAPAKPQMNATGLKNGNGSASQASQAIIQGLLSHPC
jgi:hypothetical protein